MEGPGEFSQRLVKKEKQQQQQQGEQTKPKPLEQYRGSVAASQSSNSQTHQSVAQNVTNCDLLMCIGGNEDDCSKQIIISTPTSNKWYKLATLHHQRSFAAAAVWNNTVIIAGGNRNAMNSVEQYDLESNTCKPFPRMLVGRCDHALVNLDGTLYAIGGSATISEKNSRGKTTILKDVEKFDKISNNWVPVPPLTTHRKGLAASVLGESIVVAGGLSGSVFLSSCELFDSKSMKWLSMASMQKKRYLAAAATYDTVYVFGGGVHGVNDDAEQYDFTGKKWTSLRTDLQRNRHGFTAAIVGNAVYFLGSNKYDGVTDLVERFDFATRKLTKLHSLPSARNGQCTVGIRVLTETFKRLTTSVPQ